MFTKSSHKVLAKDWMDSMNDLSSGMLRVDAIFKLPGMGVNYDSSFRDFEKFKSNNASMDLSVVHISLNSVDKINHAYLFGLMENISANSDIEWNIKEYPEGKGVLTDVSGTLLTLDNVFALPPNMSPYVKRVPVRVNVKE